MRVCGSHRIRCGQCGRMRDPSLSSTKLCFLPHRQCQSSLFSRLRNFPLQLNYLQWRWHTDSSPPNWWMYHSFPFTKFRRGTLLWSKPTGCFFSLCHPPCHIPHHFLSRSVEDQILIFTFFACQHLLGRKEKKIMKLAIGLVFLIAVVFAQQPGVKMSLTQSAINCYSDQGSILRQDVSKMTTPNCNSKSHKIILTIKKKTMERPVS